MAHSTSETDIDVSRTLLWIGGARLCRREKRKESEISSLIFLSKASRRRRRRRRRRRPAAHSPPLFSFFSNLLHFSPKQKKTQPPHLHPPPLPARQQGLPRAVRDPHPLQAHRHQVALGRHRRQADAAGPPRGRRRRGQALKKIEKNLVFLVFHRAQHFLFATLLSLLFSFSPAINFECNVAHFFLLIRKKRAGRKEKERDRAVKKRGGGKKKEKSEQ